MEGRYTSKNRVYTVLSLILQENSVGQNCRDLAYSSINGIYVVYLSFFILEYRSLGPIRLRMNERQHIQIFSGSFFNKQPRTQSLESDHKLFPTIDATLACVKPKFQLSIYTEEFSFNYFVREQFQLSKSHAFSFESSFLFDNTLL